MTTNKKSPPKSDRHPVFFKGKVGKRFRAICKKEKRTYSQQLEYYMDNDKKR